MHTVADILAEKGSVVYGIKPSATVFEAIEKMVDHNIGSLLVIDDGIPSGIVTERHYLERVALRGRTSRTTRVEEIMATEIACVAPTCTVDDCMDLMTERHARQVVVMHNAHLAGIVSIGDVVKFVARAHRDQVQYLTAR
jgi:CBS domain-containing protein